MVGAKQSPEKMQRRELLIYTSYHINNMLASILRVAVKTATIDRWGITCRCL